MRRPKSRGALPILLIGAGVAKSLLALGLLFPKGRYVVGKSDQERIQATDVRDEYLKVEFGSGAMVLSNKA
jgi:hypothetical protein